MSAARPEFKFLSSSGLSDLLRTVTTTVPRYTPQRRGAVHNHFKASIQSNPTIQDSLIGLTESLPGQQGVRDLIWNYSVSGPGSAIPPMLIGDRSVQTLLLRSMYGSAEPKVPAHTQWDAKEGQTLERRARAMQCSIWRYMPTTVLFDERKGRPSQLPASS